MIIFFFVNFIAVTIFNRQGMRTGILLGSFFTTAGLSMICLINESIVWGVLGHLVMAVAWPFLLNSASLVTTHLYSKTQ